MLAVDLIAAAVGRPELETVRGICCVTGEETDCVPRRDILGKSFTSQALLRAPTSSHIGLSAVAALRHDPERKSSWWCDGVEFVPLRRAGVRDLVLSPRPAEQWAAYATTSYKKHGALAAPVNSGARRAWLFETRVIECDASGVLETWTRLREMQDAGWPRPVLEDLDPSPFLLGKLGAAAWLRYEAWARPRMLAPLYQFLCYLLPSKEELARPKQD